MTSDAFDRFDQEAARIDAFYGGLDAAGWAFPTRCDGWDRKDLLAHLCGIEDYGRSGLDGTVGAGHEPHVGYERMNEIRVAALRPMGAGDLLAKWRAQVAYVHPALRERGGDATIDTHAGPYPLGRQVWYFASELAVHADDAGVPVTAGERAEREGWRAWFALDALQEVSPEVEVNGSEGSFTVRLGEESIELTAAELVEAAAHRLPEGRLPQKLGRALVVLA